MDLGHRRRGIVCKSSQRFVQGLVTSSCRGRTYRCQRPPARRVCRCQWFSFTLLVSTSGAHLTRAQLRWLRPPDRTGPASRRQGNETTGKPDPKPPKQRQASGRLGPSATTRQAAARGQLDHNSNREYCRICPESGHCLAAGRTTSHRSKWSESEQEENRVEHDLHPRHGHRPRRICPGRICCDQSDQGLHVHDTGLPEHIGLHSSRVVL